VKQQNGPRRLIDEARLRFCFDYQLEIERICFDTAMLCS